MISKKELKAINELLSKQKIRTFVQQNNVTNDEILSNFGKFLYVFEHEGFTLFKDSIISIVKEEEDKSCLNYLFAPQNETTIFQIDKHDIWGENKIAIMQKFLQEYKNSSKGFYMHGNVGSGKTFLSMQMARIVIEQKKYCTWISMYQYIRFILDNKDRSFINMTLNAKYLFIDDLGAESITNFYLQELFFIIDYRYKLNLPTYITSNFTLNELYLKFDAIDSTQSKRIVSRLKERCEIVNI